MADILGDAVAVYESILNSEDGARGLDYLKGRGLNANTTKAARLGYTGSPGLFYFKIKTEYKYDDEELQSAGLIHRNGETTETFKNSVIIPITDSCGRIVNITQRRIDDHQVKYLNLPHKPIYDFYGLHMLADRHIYTSANYLDTPLFICEGQFDTLLMQQSGYPALGIMGVNSIRETMFEHLKWFKSFVLCFDNDMPGKTAIKKMAQYIKFYYPNTPIYECVLPDGYNDINQLAIEADPELHIIDTLIHEMNIKEPKPFKQRKATPFTQNDELILELKKIPIKDFVESVSKGIQWSSKGMLLKAKCPFPTHSDTVGSFTIYTDKNTYFCFGCGSGGDIINFCCRMFDTNFRTAIQILKKWSKR